MSAVLLESPIDPVPLAGRVQPVLGADAGVWVDVGMPLSRAWWISLALTLVCTGVLMRIQPEPAPDLEPPRLVMHAMLVQQAAPLPMPEPTTPPPPAPQPKESVPTPTVKPAPSMAKPAQPLQPVAQPTLAAPTVPAVENPPLPTHPVEPVASPAPAVKPRETGRAAIGVVCPTQVKPVMPMAARQAGISGVVHARATVKAGRITDIQFIDGPKVFYGAVKAAMGAYQCDVNADDATAEQEFVFQLE